MYFYLLMNKDFIIIIIIIIIVWGNCGITLRNKVQKLQNRAARVLTYSSYDVDAGHLFKLLEWKNLACQQ